MENANGVIKKLTSAERSYYTAAEVREMMGVSRDTAYRMIALEKMGVLTVIRDGIPVETLEECVASVGEVFFKIEIVKGDKGFDLDVTEPQLQEAVKTMQMNQKDAVAHIRDTVEDNTVLIFLNAVDSRTAVKKEAETKAKNLGELEESAGDA